MGASIGNENLVELLDRYPDKFYFGYRQWWRGEEFTRVLPTEPLHTIVPKAIKPGKLPANPDDLPRAVDLAHIYIRHSEHPIWKSYLWTSDTDSQGQRVFIGGVKPENGNKLELHRHLSITDQWLTPVLR